MKGWITPPVDANERRMRLLDRQGALDVAPMLFAPLVERKKMPAIDTIAANRRALARDLRAQGWLLREIAAHLGVTHTTVVNYTRGMES